MTRPAAHTAIAAAILLPAALACAACAAVRGPNAAARPGTLLIAGGGPLAEALFRRFVALSGGAGRASIVIFPMASQYEDAGEELARDFEKLGARARVLRLSREEAVKDSAAAALEGVTGIWFGGGDQSRLTAALSGTPVGAAILRRWREGAAMGGTSAGAAVMSRLMITGDEKRPGGARPPSDAQTAFLTIDRENIVTSPGFGFVGGAIVDQHFVRRRRHNRLISLVLENPRLVGIGIDEATAVEVAPDGWWTVLGESVIVVYDARRARVVSAENPLGAAGMTMHVLPAGSRYRLATGEVRLPGRG